VCSIIGFSIVMPFLPFYVRELGVTDHRAVLMWVGWLSSGAGLTMAFVAPIWGVLADRHGRKLMVLRSMFGGSIVIAMMGFAQNIHQLFALRILQGVLTGTVAASVALVSSVVPERRAGFALGLMQTALMVGASLGPWIGGHYAEHYGYRLPFFIGAGFLLVGGVLTVFGVHEDFVPHQASDAEEGGSLRQVLSLTGFTTMLALLFMVQFVGSFVGPFLPLYIQRVGGLSQQSAAGVTGSIFGWSALAAASSAALLGRLGDRWGHSRVLMVCTLLTGLALFPHALARTTTQLLGLRLMVAFTDAGIMPSVNALIRGLTPRHACGKAFGIAQSCSNLGWGVGPLVGSGLAAAVGMRWPFVVVGGALVLISAAAWRVLPGMQQVIYHRRLDAELALATPGMATAPEPAECPLPVDGPK
jgi:MFS transporter, DHA1 family, multidrug resistance protein